MRVGMVSAHACIRMHKMGYALQNAGHSVHVIVNMMSGAHSFSGYSGVHVFECLNAEPGTINPWQLSKTVEELDPIIDIWHVHNEPNWIFRAVKEHTKKPVIFDIHDWTSIRNDPTQGFEIGEEKFALANADAFIVPSKGYLTKIRGESQKPSILVYSKVPSFLYPEMSKEKLPGLVYEGGVKGKNDLQYNYPYRNWAEFAKKAAENLNGSKIYFYCANSGEDLGDYDHEKIQCNAPQVYPELLKSVSRHTAGLVGSPYPLPDFKDSMPNKLFEYISAGIPVIVIHSPEAREFVEFHGLGTGIDDPGEVHDALERVKNCRVDRERMGFAMDGEIPKLLSLYEEAICSRGPRDIRQTA